MENMCAEIQVDFFENVVFSTGGSSRRFWGRPTWRSDPSQGTPKLITPRIWPTIFGEWPKITYKNKIYKRKTKKSPASGPGSSWKSMVSPVGR